MVRLNNANVASLSSPNANNTSLFGAKAANLAKATQLGFDVPKGFVVSREYGKDEFALVAQGILDILLPPVAVRSSATEEDSDSKAFAGMFETRLGIRSITDLTDAFAEVKSSGAADRLKMYHGEYIKPEHISVLIQCMVDATRAGVAFSRDPSTGKAIVIIESNYGLGKSVVDGYVTPDSYECHENGTYEAFIGRKSIHIALDKTGICVKNTSMSDSQQSSLSSEEVQEVACLTKKVERELGFPADIEWAYDAEGKLWLLQARPITTL